MQLNSNIQSHWSSGSTACLPLRGAVVRVPGMHTCTYNTNGISCCDVMLHYSIKGLLGKVSGSRFFFSVWYSLVPPSNAFLWEPCEGDRKKTVKMTNSKNVQHVMRLRWGGGWCLFIFSPTIFRLTLALLSLVVPFISNYNMQGMHSSMQGMHSSMHGMHSSMHGMHSSIHPLTINCFSYSSQISMSNVRYR